MVAAQAEQGARSYRNTLTPIEPRPLLAQWPRFMEPVHCETRFEGPMLVDDGVEAELAVRGWRWSYNARGIIEVPNRLRLADTAVVVVHPWGIDDGQGWRTPQPAGVCDMCTEAKNFLAGEHTTEVINPLVARLRSAGCGMVLYSLRASTHPITDNLYRTMHKGKPSAEVRAAAAVECREALQAFEYDGHDAVPTELSLSEETPVADYFRQFPGLDSGDGYNGAGFWELPVPVVNHLDVDEDDVVVWDDQGYDQLRDFLKGAGIRHCLMMGYAADMCLISTTAGYQNLSQDFNCFIVGDATMATFPANDSPAFATNAAISFASLDQMITECGWITLPGEAQVPAPRRRGARL